MTCQYLTFKLNETLYAISVFQIQEVLEYEKPQSIPCSSPLLMGVIRSRNSNIAVIDIPQKFDLETVAPTDQSRIIVLEILDKEEGVINLFGIIADNVVEVLELESEQLEPLPKSEVVAGSKFVTSLYSHDDTYTLILDVNKIFSDKEISAFNKSKSKIKNKDK